MVRKTRTVAFSADKMTLKRMEQITEAYEIGTSALVCNLINQEWAENKDNLKS